jgi:hypothetical protein
MADAPLRDVDGAIWRDRPTRLGACEPACIALRNGQREGSSAVHVVSIGDEAWLGDSEHQSKRLGVCMFENTFDQPSRQIAAAFETLTFEHHFIWPVCATAIGSNGSMRGVHYRVPGDGAQTLRNTSNRRVLLCRSI